MERTLDWLSFTHLDYTMDAPEVMERLGLDFSPMKHGFHGYRSGMISPRGVMVLFDGGEGMGVHVQMSSQGLREYEGREGFPGWEGDIESLRKLGVKFTRVDIAFDDHSGERTVLDISEMADRGEAVSRWKSSNYNKRVGMGTTRLTGETVYFGSMKSDAMCRAYDKGLETKTEERGNWVRFEFQFRAHKADAIAAFIASGNWDTVAAVCRGLLDFRTPTADTNKARWPVQEWWERGISKAKAALCIARPAMTLEKAYNWLQKQVAPTLAMFAMLDGGGVDTVLSLIVEGTSRMKDKHLRAARTQLPAGFSFGELPALAGAL